MTISPNRVSFSVGNGVKYGSLEDRKVSSFLVYFNVYNDSMYKMKASIPRTYPPCRLQPCSSCRNRSSSNMATNNHFESTISVVYIPHCNCRFQLLDIDRLMKSACYSAIMNTVTTGRENCLIVLQALFHSSL